MSKLFFLFGLVPFVEVYLLLQIARHMGFMPTFAMVLVTGFVGVTLARREGLRVLGKWRETLAGGQVPEEGLLSALLVFLGGVLLVIPGVLTDLVGVLLLLPPTRRLVAAQVRRRLERSMRRGAVRVTHFGVGGPFGDGPFGQGPRDVTPRGPSGPRKVIGQVTEVADPAMDTRARRIDRKDGDLEVEDAELVDDGHDPRKS